MNSVGKLRALASELATRSRFWEWAGKTFHGRRDFYEALGYKRNLTVGDYRGRYRRNGVARRVVRSFPEATWRGGPELIEDADPTTLTPFEEAMDLFNERLKLWPNFLSVDVAAGIGRYGVMVIGLPGETSQPVDKASLDDIKYLQVFTEQDAKIFKWDLDINSPRFGLPAEYQITRVNITPSDQASADYQTNSRTTGKVFHWTRVLHVTDYLLDDNVYSAPRLECCWNFIDDLDKIIGGGAEAYWKRADQGVQFNLDPDVEFGDESDPGADIHKNSAYTSFKKQIEEYEHGLRRFLTTRGVTVNSIGSDVAPLGDPAQTLFMMISASTAIPQRVLMGSEQAKLAASADKTAFDDRTQDRRDMLSGPMMVRPLIDRLISWGALPAPKEYEVRWPDLKIMDDKARAAVAVSWAQLNQLMQQTVVTPDEIRDRVLGLPKLSADQIVSMQPPPAPGQEKNQKALTRKWKYLTSAEKQLWIAREHAQFTDFVDAIRNADANEVARMLGTLR